MKQQVVSFILHLALPMPTSILPLEELEHKLISRLLRLRHASSYFNAKELCDHIEKFYDIKIPYTSKLNSKGKIGYKSTQLSGLFNAEETGVIKGTGMDKPGNIDKWRNFLNKERQKLIDDVNADGSFNVPYIFNYGSAIELSLAGKNADLCLYFNTKINNWHNPLVQMHLCIQKSIEGKINYSAVLNSTKIPSYRQYRILLLPDTREEFNKRLKDKFNGFAEDLKFLTLMHCSLSIQLAVLNVSDLAIIMRKHQDFFKNKEILKILGLSEDLSNLFELENNLSFELKLKGDIIKMGNLTEIETTKGLDFIYFKKDVNESEQKPYNNIWSAYYEDRKQGLTYSPTVEKEISAAKQKFSETVFQEITEEVTAKKCEIKSFDPLYDIFYNTDRNLSFFNLYEKYDAIYISNLNKERFYE